MGFVAPATIVLLVMELELIEVVAVAAGLPPAINVITVPADFVLPVIILLLILSAVGTTPLLLIAKNAPVPGNVIFCTVLKYSLRHYGTCTIVVMFYMDSK